MKHDTLPHRVGYIPYSILEFINRSRSIEELHSIEYAFDAR